VRKRAGPPSTARIDELLDGRAEPPGQDLVEAQQKAIGDLVEQQWKAQQKAIAELLERGQERGVKTADQWEALRKVIADQIE
jgi:hypothetical protein